VGTTQRGVVMPFYPGIHRTGPVGKGGAYIPKFHNCKKCGKKFEENEKIWKRVSTSSGTKAYYCNECYEGLFIDV